MVRLVCLFAQAASKWRTRAEAEAARAEARRVVEQDLAAGSDMWWSPTIRAALVAGMPWLDVHCPGCGTIRALDIPTVDRHPLASRAGAAVLVVSGRGANAADRWIARAAASGGRKVHDARDE
jgi:hypothetical protein